ncbi:hypothetical protein RQ831_03980 [Roseomonas gilardii]|uniref:DUF3168 domain-containing protein n=1 Tax=Roseomonas gilardii TaxID=257708 RepID=A0ABU3MBH6_9PROT|nr:hypothetical protein [Roseomonas gilardii]MDT8330200.1 hypothetical protein [Roseomonas gilardii]
MDAFAAMTAALHADPNLGTHALWQPGGAGPFIPVRIILSEQDDMAGRARAGTIRASIARSGLPTRPSRGDPLTFADQTGTRLCKVDGTEEPDAWTYELRLSLA